MFVFREIKRGSVFKFSKLKPAKANVSFKLSDFTASPSQELLGLAKSLIYYILLIITAYQMSKRIC